MENKIKLSVVLPLYNEEGNITKAVAEIQESVKEFCLAYEIILVESGSSDDSARICLEMSRKNPNIKLIRQFGREGLGSGIRHGFANALYEYIFYTDSDRSIFPREIKRFVEAAGDADLVIGYREKRQDRPLRMVYTKIYNFIIRRLFRLKVKDVNFACKLIKRHVLADCHLKCDGAFCDAELLIEAAKYSYKIKELPVTSRAREVGVSTLGTVSVILNIFREMFWYFLTSYHQRPSRKNRFFTTYLNP